MVRCQARGSRSTVASSRPRLKIGLRPALIERKDKSIFLML
jgi:hypothetical protein